MKLKQWKIIDYSGINQSSYNNKVKRIFSFFLTIIILFYALGFTNLSYANLDDNEEINLEEIQESVETSASVSEEPKLEARIALVYDRNSGNVL